MWPNLSLHITSFRLRAWYANTIERRNYPRRRQRERAGANGRADYEGLADGLGLTERLGLTDGLEPALGTALTPGDAVDSAG